MTSSEIREKFLDFFKDRGHTVVPSSSLLPDDPSVLLTTAGMQQFKPYYTGQFDPFKTIHFSLGAPLNSKNAASVQKSFRTSDIDSVGDESHLTFFEMLGNFSFGGYFKKESIEWAHEFITKAMGLEISYVTVFEGSHGVPKDEESKKIWNNLGISDVREDNIENVFWGPTGSEGPCGPTTEIYCRNAENMEIEVWNIVFNEFYFAGSREELLTGKSGKKLEALKTPGVDTGMGLERLAMISQKTKTIFETDLFAPILEILPKGDSKPQRIIADHLRGSVFLLADGVRVSNKGAGYILRRLIRRSLVCLKQLNAPVHLPESLVHEIIHQYGDFYPELLKQSEIIMSEFSDEQDKFLKTMEKGMKELEKIETMTGKAAFDIYQSFGLPPEVVYEFKKFDWDEFNKAKADHLAVSSSGAEKKFGGHGLILDTGELKAGSENEIKKITRLHTASHLLNQALHDVLGEEVMQAGSDITVERARFDFTFGRKLTPEELKKIENIVNEKIEQDLPVKIQEIPKQEAIEGGARAFRPEKYPEVVKVYSIGKDEDWRNAYSKELCGGPHVARTGEIGKFKVLKEESSSAGVRRIRITVEP